MLVVCGVVLSQVIPSEVKDGTGDSMEKPGEFFPPHRKCFMSSRLTLPVSLLEDLFCFLLSWSLPLWFFSYFLVWCTIRLKHGCLHFCLLLLLWFTTSVFSKKKLALRSSPLVFPSVLDGESLVTSTLVIELDVFFWNLDQTLSISGFTTEKQPKKVVCLFCFLFSRPLVDLDFVHPHWTSLACRTVSARHFASTAA